MMKEPFWLGGAAASMAACFTHPIDQTKYRLQVMTSRASMFKTMTTFVKRDGILSLWSGLSASILRQSTYSTARFALYETFSKKWSKNGSGPLATMLCAGAAGGLAGIVGNPAEIVLVRMSADGAKPPIQRYNYRNALTGLFDIGKNEGLRAYARGLGPNVMRSVLMNMSQLGAYVEVKRLLLHTHHLHLQDNVATHILASFIAGTIATTVCAPADVLKSRFQNAAAADGAQRGVFRYVQSTIRQEGPGFLMKGWLPAWCRLAPNTILTFVFMEQLKRMWQGRSSPQEQLVLAKA